MSRPSARPKAASPTRQTRLAGPSSLPDPRTSAYRPDLADVALAGRVIAANYAEPALLRCLVPSVAMRADRSPDAVAVSELLFGEAFAVVERGPDWSWGYSLHDNYVGYVPSSALGEAAPPTHRVAAPAGLLFSEASIKSPLVATLPLGAAVTVIEADGAFHRLAGGFIHERHLGPLRPGAGDPVALAHEFLGTPYLWGGRTRAGIDCSGLVQTVLAATGHDVPRDSDQQRHALGSAVDPADIRRGDIVFFPGHVGIMASATDLLHANAYWMRTVVEPLADVVARLKPGHDQPILAVKRL